jgi:hypothetical protein
MRVFLVKTTAPKRFASSYLKTGNTDTSCSLPRSCGSQAEKQSRSGGGRRNDQSQELKIKSIEKNRKPKHRRRTGEIAGGFYLQLEI